MNKKFSTITILLACIGMFNISIANASLDLSDVHIPDPNVVNMKIEDTSGNVIQENKHTNEKVSRGNSCVAPIGTEQTCRGTVGIFGKPNHKVTYKWNVHYVSNSKVAVRVKGYKQNKKVNQEYWVSAGVGTSGKATVNWGNVLAVKSVKVRSISIPAGAIVNWE